MPPMSRMSRYAVYTTIAVERLEMASRADESSEPLTEEKRWVSAKALLEEARAAGEDMPIIFSDSRDCSVLIRWAVLQDVVVGPANTTFRFARLAPLREHSTQELVLRSSGQNIAPNFIRPYALCETPAFLTHEDKTKVLEPKQNFTADEYAAAFRGLTLSPHHLRMLQAHYHAPNRTLTATQMSVALGYSGYRVANLHYGRLGSLVGERLAWMPLPEQTVAVLCTFEKPEHEWHWIMRPSVARAVEKLGWVDDARSEIPEEIEPASPFYEGAARRISVNAYERSSAAREKCILHYGCRCSACGLGLAEKYGAAALGLIHVHHVRQLAEINAEYQVDPIQDLRPVCPSCHAVIHTKTPPFTVDEVRTMIEEQNRTKSNGGD